MLVLHGLGDSMEGYRWMPEMMDLPWLNYLLVNAPDDYFGGYSWYEFDGNASVGIERSRRLLTELLDEQAKRGFSAEQTFLFGFSQGGLMALETGLQYPQPFAGLISISGYVHEPERLLSRLSPVARDQQCLVTHGRYDPLIPFDPVQAQIQQLGKSGVQIEWHAFDKDHTIAGHQELEVIRDFVQAHRSRSG
jgi:phospholipase/carboxylesterase